MRVEEIQVLVADVILPPPDIAVSQWADENRRLSSESAAERGEWRTDRAPYQRAIMDALSPSHPCEQVVLMSGAQLGKSSMLENFIGFIIDFNDTDHLDLQGATKFTQILRNEIVAEEFAERAASHLTATNRQGH
jgi:phage terminase large subunit GpA-like protein